MVPLKHAPYISVTKGSFFDWLRRAEMAAHTVAEERPLEDRILYILGEQTFGYKLEAKGLGDPRWYMLADPLKETP